MEFQAGDKLQLTADVRGEKAGTECVYVKKSKNDGFHIVQLYPLMNNVTLEVSESEIKKI